jgi:hypothetical protein
MNIPEDVQARIAAYIPEDDSSREGFSERVLEMARVLHQRDIHQRGMDLIGFEDILRILNANIPTPTNWNDKDKFHTNGYNKWMWYEQHDYDVMTEQDRRPMLVLDRIYPKIVSHISENEMSQHILTRLVQSDEFGQDIDILWPRSRISVMIREVVIYESDRYSAISRCFIWIKNLMDSSSTLEIRLYQREEEYSDEMKISLRIVPTIQIIDSRGEELILFLETVLSFHTGPMPLWEIEASDEIQSLLRMNANRLWKYGIDTRITCES